jgi:hypothetical protein
VHSSSTARKTQRTIPIRCHVQPRSSRLFQKSQKRRQPIGCHHSRRSGKSRLRRHPPTGDKGRRESSGRRAFQDARLCNSDRMRLLHSRMARRKDQRRNQQHGSRKDFRSPRRPTASHHARRPTSRRRPSCSSSEAPLTLLQFSWRAVRHRFCRGSLVSSAPAALLRFLRFSLQVEFRFQGFCRPKGLL